MMLLQKNATVTICHSATQDLTAITLQADVVVAAVGKRNVLTADMVKPGAVVIDVGMNRNDEGKLCGDVDFAGVQRGGRLDHAGARRRRPDDARDAAGQHAEAAERAADHGRSKPHAAQRSATPELTQNERHDQSPPRLQRPPPLRPDPAASTSRPPSTSLLAEADAALETVDAAPSSRPTGTRSPRCWTSPPRRFSRAWGAVSHLNGVADTPELRAAYNEALPQGHRVLDPAGLGRAAVCQVQGHRRRPRCNAEQRQAHKNAMRNFVLGGAELTGAARSASPPSRSARPSCSQKFSENALDATDAFAYYAARGRTGRRAGRRDPGRPRRGAGRGQGRLQAHAEDALLPAGHAVRAQQRAARAPLPRLRHPRQRPGRPEVRQQRADPRDPGAAPGRSAAAGLSPTSAKSRSCPRWPIRPQQVHRASCATWRAAPGPTPRRTWPTCAPSPRAELGIARPAGLGLVATSARSSRKRAMPSASRRSSSTSPRPRCWPACSRSSRRCSR